MLVINAQLAMDLVESAIGDLAMNVGEHDAVALRSRSHDAWKKLGEARSLLRQPHLREAGDQSSAGGGETTLVRRPVRGALFVHGRRYVAEFLCGLIAADVVVELSPEDDNLTVWTTDGTYLGIAKPEIEQPVKALFPGVEVVHGR